MNFFVDADISYRFTKMLAALSQGYHEVVHITEHKDFAHNNNQPGGNSTPDIEWITKLGTSGIDWTVISGEADIIDTAHERAALIQSGLTLFSLDHNWGKVTFAEQSWKIVKIWTEIVRHAEMPRPALYRVHMGKKLSIETIKSGMRARGGKFKP
jgi:PIN domain-containing protein